MTLPPTAPQSDTINVTAGYGSTDLPADVAQSMLYVAGLYFDGEPLGSGSPLVQSRLIDAALPPLVRQPLDDIKRAWSALDVPRVLRRFDPATGAYS